MKVEVRRCRIPDRVFLLTMQELITKVEEWADEKGILEKATPVKQALKTLEEAGELVAATAVEDRHEVIDAIGDVLVTLIIQCKMQDVFLEDCLAKAYSVISKRTGKMINGQFVKDK